MWKLTLMSPKDEPMIIGRLPVDEPDDSWRVVDPQGVLSGKHCFYVGSGGGWEHVISTLDSEGQPDQSTYRLRIIGTHRLDVAIYVPGWSVVAVYTAGGHHLFSASDRGEWWHDPEEGWRRARWSRKENKWE